ncbi:hypothetical protein ACIGXF_32330 [Streptomyces sp. NPDC053086]|uniref:hypothetical protein n=1 Tax=unclassified Streptomyces TaxID=2593676 RepID=UPI0037D1709C
MNPARRTTATAVVLAASGALLSVVAPPASAAANCASPVYKREFFANTSFSGTPKRTDCDSAVSEQWGTGAPATGLRYYTVHRGELVGDEDEQVCYGTATEYVSPSQTSYAYTTLPDGGHVCFFVDAVDEEGNSAIRWNGPAEAVTATELDMTPAVATPEGSPLALEATPAAGTEGNRLTWTGLGAGDGESAEPAQGFRLYRWNPAASAYEKIAELDAGAFEYLDTGAGRGTTSYYWVTGVKADGSETLPAGDWAVTAP